MQKKKQEKNTLFAKIMGGCLLGTGLLIIIVYAIVGVFKAEIAMPCELQVTVSALISFGISFVWKLMGEEK